MGVMVVVTAAIGSVMVMVVVKVVVFMKVG